LFGECSNFKNYFKNFKVFRDYGVVVIRLNVATALRKVIVSTLCADVKGRQDDLGPCRKIGLMTGGGLPHCQGACMLRALPAYREFFMSMLEATGRFVPGVGYIPTFGAATLQ